MAATIPAKVELTHFEQQALNYGYGKQVNKIIALKLLAETAETALDGLEQQIRKTPATDPNRAALYEQLDKIEIEQYRLDEKIMKIHRKLERKPEFVAAARDNYHTDDIDHDYIIDGSGNEEYARWAILGEIFGYPVGYTIRFGPYWDFTKKTVIVWYDPDADTLAGIPDSWATPHPRPTREAARKAALESVLDEARMRRKHAEEWAAKNPNPATNNDLISRIRSRVTNQVT